MVRIQRPTRSPTFIDKASALEELRRVTDAVFKSCATGRTAVITASTAMLRLAHQIFMRRQDLVKLFDEELAERNDFRTSVDRVYDDTLQLQLEPCHLSFRVPCLGTRELDEDVEVTVIVDDDGHGAADDDDDDNDNVCFCQPLTTTMIIVMVIIVMMMMMMRVTLVLMATIRMVSC
eukprot:s418_g1.t1